MGATAVSVSFNPYGSQLLTNLGAIALPKLPLVGHAAAHQVCAPPFGAELSNDHRVGYGFSRYRSWITWHGVDILLMLEVGIWRSKLQFRTSQRSSYISLLDRDWISERHRTRGVPATPLHKEICGRTI